MPSLFKRKPQRLMNEEEVLKMLGISDFRHLSKKTAIEFISSIPQMDPEVAKKALEQFPELANMALGLAKDYKESLKDAMEANNKSSEDSLKAINVIIDVLSEQLKKEDLTPEERMHTMNCLTSLASEMRGIHKDNQNFLLKGLAVFAGVAAAVAAGAVAVLGANGRIEAPSLSDEEDGEEEF